MNNKKMLTPVRCFTCGKVMYQSMWTKYEDSIKNGTDPVKVFESLGMNRYCCRRMLMTSVDLSEKIMSYIPESEK